MMFKSLVIAMRTKFEEAISALRLTSNYHSVSIGRLLRRSYATSRKDERVIDTCLRAIGTSLRAQRSNPFLVTKLRMQNGLPRLLQRLAITLTVILSFSFAPTQAAIEFDGVDDYVSIANSNELDVLTAYTLSAWINPDLINNYNTVFWRGAGAASEIEFYGRAVDSVILHNRAGSGGTLTYKTGPALSTGWQHLCIVYGGNTASWKVYTDGIEQIYNLTSGAGENPVDNNSDWQIGKGGTAFGASEFNGTIDDARIYNRAISLAEIEVLSKSRSKRIGGSLANGLVAHYEMDDDEIGAIAAQAQDRSGNMNHGEFINFSNITTSLSNDIPISISTGTSLEFDGATESIQADIDLSTTNVVTTSFWFNKSSYTGVKALLELTNNFNSSSTSFVLLVDETGGPCAGYGLVIGLRGNAGYNLACRTAVVPLNEWHHYVSIFDKSAVATDETQIYVDGVLQIVDKPGGFVQENTNNFANDTLYFMSRAGTSLFEHGTLDDVRIYNKRLTPTEITFLHNGTGLNPGTSNLEALWAFDDSAVKDSSGNNNHGLGFGGDSLQYTEGVLRR